MLNDDLKISSQNNVSSGKKGYRDNPQISTLPHYFQEFLALVLSSMCEPTLMLLRRIFPDDFSELNPLDLLYWGPGPKKNIVGTSNARQWILT
jgi:hypothetical protein